MLLVVAYPRAGFENYLRDKEKFGFGICSNKIQSPPFPYFLSAKMLLGWVWGFLFLSFQSARGFREGQALWPKQVLRDGSLDPPANGTKAGSCSEFSISI